jgi:hypothetical protein
MSARDGVGTLQLSAHQVRTWRTRSVNRRIFSAMLSVGGVVLVVKVAALAKDVVTASYFGTSDAMDAFLIAFVLPTFAINVIAGSLEAAVVPVYVGVRDADGPEAAKQLLSSVLVTSTALLVAMGVVLLIIGPLLLPALGATFVGEKLAMTQRVGDCAIVGTQRQRAVSVAGRDADHQLRPDARALVREGAAVGHLRVGHRTGRRPSRGRTRVGLAASRDGPARLEGVAHSSPGSRTGIAVVPPCRRRRRRDE